MPGHLTLWGVGTARTMRPHWALHELGLQYDLQAIQPRTGETSTADYTRLNPRQKVPLLQDDEFVIGESAAIIAYLARVYGHDDVQLVPHDPEEYARWLEWCFFIVTELDSTSLYVMRRHDVLRHIYGEAPQAVQEAATYFRKQLLHVESALADGREFLVGDHFTTADILLGTCLRWAIEYDVGISDVAVPYLERLDSRPGFKAGHMMNYTLPVEPIGLRN